MSVRLMFCPCSCPLFHPPSLLDAEEIGICPFTFFNHETFLFWCYRFGVVFLAAFCIADECAEGKFSDQYLVICQLKFTALLRRISPSSGECSFHGKVNMQPALFCTQFLWVPSCISVRMLCVIFNIPFLMQRTQDGRVTCHVSHAIMTSGIF